MSPFTLVNTLELIAVIMLLAWGRRQVMTLHRITQSFDVNASILPAWETWVKNAAAIGIFLVIISSLPFEVEATPANAPTRIIDLPKTQFPTGLPATSVPNYFYGTDTPRPQPSQTPRVQIIINTPPKEDPVTFPITETITPTVQANETTPTPISEISIALPPITPLKATMTSEPMAQVSPTPVAPTSVPATSAPATTVPVVTVAPTAIPVQPTVIPTTVPMPTQAPVTNVPTVAPLPTNPPATSIPATSAPVITNSPATVAPPPATSAPKPNPTKDTGRTIMGSSPTGKNQ